MTGPLILFRTPFFRGPVPLGGVPERLRGHFTTDQAQLREADAVVFHIPDWRRTQLPFGLKAALSARGTRLLRWLGGRRPAPFGFQ